MTDHWCTYCNGVNTHNCQYNQNLPRMKIYTTNTTAVSDNEAILRQALEALEVSTRFVYAGMRPQCEDAIAALRERLGEKESR